jgi:hypothetical protein
MRLCLGHASPGGPPGDASYPPAAGPKRWPPGLAIRDPEQRKMAPQLAHALTATTSRERDPVALPMHPARACWAVQDDRTMRQPWPRDQPRPRPGHAAVTLMARSRGASHRA